MSMTMSSGALCGVLNTSLHNAKVGDHILWNSGVFMSGDYTTKATVVTVGIKWMEALSEDGQTLSIQRATGRIYDSRRKGGVQVGFAFKDRQSRARFRQSLDQLNELLNLCATIRTRTHGIADLLPHSISDLTIELRSRLAIADQYEHDNKVEAR